MVDLRNEQYTRDDISVQDDVDNEAPQQAPEITILTSGEEGGTEQEEEEDQPRDQPGPVETISIDLNEENAPVTCKWGSFLPSNHTFIY